MCMASERGGGGGGDSGFSLEKLRRETPSEIPFYS